MALSMDIRERVMKAIEGGMSRRKAAARFDIGPATAIRWAKRAHVLYLPPYSPDFDPIEKPFSKIKSILQRIAARTVEALDTAVGEALQSFTPKECANYFASSRYDAI